MNNSIAEKNKASWNAGAARYAQRAHAEQRIRKIIENPACAFHRTTWGLIQRYLPDLRGKRVCVPSSGDNLAVFAFASLGASVTSCDISENQLANAERVAQQYGLDKRIDFVCADTMALDGVADAAYDFVYTSNGVHVWINDLPAMYQSVHRILKPGGLYILYEIHPMQRPIDYDEKRLDGKLTVTKPYDQTGPFDDGYETTFHWRMMDILNAMLASGLAIGRMEEMFAEKDYDEPFWVANAFGQCEALSSREEIDALHDWRHNPVAALPNWFCVVARKEMEHNER
ncbi:MAG: class I SAM-dependent methyltransferase [Oscillospiraceae bacterium]|jgi:SAM-dependent methyltransferase|nr:class I SAM-dependent methyltransferase [Oscillospiraceae bacterium]